MEPWYGGWNRGETWRDFIGGAMRGDIQNANPNSTYEVLQNVEDGFYICPAYGFSTGITPYVQDVLDIWSFGRQFGSRNMASRMRNFP